MGKKSVKISVEKWLRKSKTVSYADNFIEAAQAMIPKEPISPLFKSSLFSWEWYSAAQDDVFFEANTSPCFSSAANLNPANQSTLRSTPCENNCKLQVVPELESTAIDTTCEESINFASFSNQEFTFYVQSPMEKRSQFNDCLYSERRKATNPNMEILSLPKNAPRKLSESEIELLKLLSPSLVGKSPKVLSSGENRNSTPEDLSVYLPENFTPAPVEKLVSSLEETIFKFPEITKKEVKHQECEQRDSSNEKGDLWENKTIEPTFSESEDSPENAKECQKRKVNSVKRANSKLPSRRKRRKTSQNHDEKDRASCSNLDESELRNKMERDRRTELNSKFNNLRDSIPELDGNSKASKISILTSAASFCAELKETDAKLQQQKLSLKQENNRLWNYLLKLSSEQ